VNYIVISGKCSPPVIFDVDLLTDKGNYSIGPLGKAKAKSEANQNRNSYKNGDQEQGWKGKRQP